MKKCLVIADDFTGANDTGVQLTKRGLETHVVLDGKNIKNDDSSYVLDTESRSLGGENAYKSLKKHLNGIFDINYEVVYKKVDSTLRGNIAFEVKAVDEEYNPEIIIFAPAFPIIGRTTANGIHFVNGDRITETEFSKDPMKPVVEDNIVKILQTGFQEKIIHHYLKEIREGKIDFTSGRIHSFDAEENQDLEIIVIAALNTGKKILWVGSAGMADVILKVKNPLKPSLAIIGSLSQVSREQIIFAEEKGVKVLRVYIAKILEYSNLTEYIEKGVEIINGGEDLIITSSYDEVNYLEAIKIGEKLSMSKEEVSIMTQDILGDIGKEVIEKANISGLFITGGDTAIGFINSTNALGSHIIEEIITGIPLMKLNGGNFDGLKMITKAGAFGNKDALFYSLGKLKEES